MTWVTFSGRYWQRVENELAKAAAGHYPSPPRPLAIACSGPPKARIAQSVEQLAFNQLVLGSSPSPRISLNRLTFNGLRVGNPPEIDTKSCA